MSLRRLHRLSKAQINGFNTGLAAQLDKTSFQLLPMDCFYIDIVKHIDHKITPTQEEYRHAIDKGQIKQLDENDLDSCNKYIGA